MPPTGTWGSDGDNGINRFFIPQARAWSDGGFDADHGFAFDGVGRRAHWSRARGLIGAVMADVRAPLLCVRLLHHQI